MNTFVLYFVISNLLLIKSKVNSTCLQKRGYGIDEKYKNWSVLVNDGSSGQKSAFNLDFNSCVEKCQTEVHIRY